MSARCDALDKLCQTIGYEFSDPELLQAAMTHSSYSNESGGVCNERLEFLGDSVLGFLAAEQLFQNHPQSAEGELTRLRASYVCEPNLAAAARKLHLGDCLRLGRGEEAGGGAARDSLLSDAFEALLGAVYLDGGAVHCRRILRRFLLSAPVVEAVRDAKTALQEQVQARGEPSPCYRLVSESGPDHQKTFVSEVLVSGAPVAQGEGRSKKLSEQAAATAALQQLTENR